MFQGTASNSGKTTLAAGFCRLLARAGLNVAPFKAQNMSLNSWVTEAGDEMGIAQAFQAQACGLSPSALMNPVLLKPLGQRRSQIIVRGQPVGSMDYEKYLALKAKIWRDVKESYIELAKGRDIMVLEGAGSPAEINLRKNDIVNMAMAEFACAKVILVADIDRGGAFAALAGTMALLSPKDRKHVSGFALNKFRGEPRLLQPALLKIEKRYHRPFLGIVPMLDNLLAPEEDSVNLQKIAAKPLLAKDKGCLDIAVVDLPALSNMADWDALSREPQVRIRLLSKGEELGEPDLLILPGSRNTPNAIAFLHKSGLFEAIRNYAAKIWDYKRGNILGICAGLQILGQTVNDPHGLEGGGSHSGLGLLALATELKPAKTLNHISGFTHPGIANLKLPCAGYEIHHGQCQSVCAQVITGSSGEKLGWGSLKAGVCRIWGTWLHGILDNDDFRHAFLDRMRCEAGLAPQAGENYDLGADLDRLADALAENLDVPAILASLANKNK